MTNEFKLPGAEYFSRYLERQVQGTLTVEGPENVNEYVKRWVISAGGERLGEYRIVESPPGEVTGHVYEGRVPSYVNKSIVAANLNEPVVTKRAEDFVALEFSRLGSGGILLRRDGHSQIPFP